MIEKLQAEIRVRYWEDASVNGAEDEDGNLIPCRDGDTWNPIIDFESGKILNWEDGKTAEIHYKVCDEGVYRLVDEKGNVVKEKEGYVPSIMYPEGDGFGDYVIMKVNCDGTICNWKKDLTCFDEE